MDTPSGWYVLFVGPVTETERDMAERNGWKLAEARVGIEPHSSELGHLLFVPGVASREEAEGALKALGRPPGDFKAAYPAT